MVRLTALPVALGLLVLSAIGSVSAGLAPRAAADNTVHVTSAKDLCLILPRSKHTNIGDSEHPGGMRSFCNKPYGNQGQLPSNFWTEAHFSSKNGRSGKRQVQVTGCINPRSSSQLNANDGGGQYDSSGGVGGRGNPEGSVCTGYKHYVEIVEPDARRACIRCCDSMSDCDVSRDTAGCPTVIPGNYGSCR
ncbi:hypothetical protein K437DRAFT_255464 [Tilletiaria anomala UBC 951]|uniref:Secreted protein n=1 Tax=Tilletiaria anomala (strain ATCC 24038 / CBS 436.72 / UBC 951) TaxID=1037660 RepID=A0A066W7I0_TILAU|nr:uncharacterized protein K437DRAFT_255464 [Tilletiaria anomala UBC 951]KDN48493.1 hypothetical protein K437DRAFT_255464 [Tilletiaria anomala UBC 951]